MPLDKSGSKEAFSRNVSAEMHAGKPQKQAVAIAYATQRRGRAEGGAVSDPLKALATVTSALANNGPQQASGMGANPASSAMGAPPLNTPAPAMNGVAPAPQQMMQPPTAMGSAGVMPMSPGTPVQRFGRGGTPNLATGGLGMVKTPKMTPTWQEKQQAHNLTKGPILSAVPGRTDAHKTHVASGSYVIPADIVSGRGQGNTIAGAGALSKLFKLGPYGTSSTAMHAGRSPHIAAPKLMAAGGRDGQHVGKPVRVNLAGGEIVLSPEHLIETFHRLYPKRHYTLKQIHSILDSWVLHERKNLRKTLANLPGPVKS